MYVPAGNDQMKVENFSAAVEFYSKAIQLNPQNAVYFCNRYMHSFFKSKKEKFNAVVFALSNNNLKVFWLHFIFYFLENSFFFIWKCI